MALGREDDFHMGVEVGDYFDGSHYGFEFE
jgi:hypothetical protein